MLLGHEIIVSSGAFSPDGRALALAGGLASAGKTIRLWDVASHKQVAVLSGHERSVNSVAFSPDGRTLASGSDDKTIRLWNVASHKQVALLRGHKQVYSVAFSPDGRILASGFYNGNLSLWDVAGHKQVALWDVASQKDVAVISVAFSPDGRTLASGFYNGNLRLWDLASHKEIAVLRGDEESPVSSVAFSTDGRTLASGSYGTIRLWDLASHKEIAVLRGHKGVAQTVAFSPDGRTLTALSHDGTILLWDEQQLERAKVRDWHAQALQDERRFGLVLEDLALVPKERTTGKPQFFKLTGSVEELTTSRIFVKELLLVCADVLLGIAILSLIRRNISWNWLLRRGFVNISHILDYPLLFVLLGCFFNFLKYSPFASTSINGSAFMEGFAGDGFLIITILGATVYLVRKATYGQFDGIMKIFSLAILAHALMILIFESALLWLYVMAAIEIGAGFLIRQQGIKWNSKLLRYLGVIFISLVSVVLILLHIDPKGLEITQELVFFSFLGLNILVVLTTCIAAVYVDLKDRRVKRRPLQTDAAP